MTFLKGGCICAAVFSWPENTEEAIPPRHPTGNPVSLAGGVLVALGGPPFRTQGH